MLLLYKELWAQYKFFLYSRLIDCKFRDTVIYMVDSVITRLQFDQIDVKCNLSFKVCSTTLGTIIPCKINNTYWFVIIH